MFAALASAAIFACVDPPQEPLFVVDRDRCTHVELASVRRGPSASLRDFTLRVEQGVPNSRERFVWTRVVMRVDCRTYDLSAVKETDYDRSGKVTRSGGPKTPMPMPKVTDPLQIKALKAVCAAPLR